MNNEELTENEISCFVDEIIKDTLPECLLERLEYIKTIEVCKLFSKKSLKLTYNLYDFQYKQLAYKTLNDLTQRLFWEFLILTA